MNKIKRTLLKPARYNGVEYDAGVELEFEESLKQTWVSLGIIAADETAPEQSAPLDIFVQRHSPPTQEQVEEYLEAKKAAVDDRPPDAPEGQVLDDEGKPLEGEGTQFKLPEETE